MKLNEQNGVIQEILATTTWKVNHFLLMKETCIKLKHENTDLVKRNVWGLADKIHVSTEQKY